LSWLGKYDKILVVLYFLSLPLCNPWVRGDGVGYYAYVRSLMVERGLYFEKDWQHGNESFTMGRIDPNGSVLANQYTQTGHISNLWSIGPSILWAPFITATHAAVLFGDIAGAHIAADGFSTPYLIAMAVATSFYGFLGLWISFRLARKYFDERWAFLATLGVWWASSLPVYMYFNPSWSHAHSAFVVALFLWYWNRTRPNRSITQWLLLGLISGLMVDVYYPNGVLLLIPLLEALGSYWRLWGSEDHQLLALSRLFALHVLYCFVFVAALLPTLVSRKIIFGSALQTGYMPSSTWNWRAPQFWNVLFSSDHGMLSWTPILLLAVIGIFFFARADRVFAIYLGVAFLAFYTVIALYPDWDGMSSFGNRFFISLTTLFVLGLTAFFNRLAHAWDQRRTRVLVPIATAVLILWNLGLIFQWGTHLIPARGPISWRSAAYNQVAVVPVQVAGTLKRYLTRRRQLMGNIEEQDVHQLKSQDPDKSE
jgi:hypothetical protein